MKPLQQYITEQQIESKDVTSVESVNTILSRGLHKEFIIVYAPLVPFQDRFVSKNLACSKVWWPA